MKQEASSKKIQRFTDLFAWQESHKLVLCIYILTKKLPESERYGIKSQMERSAVSVTSNIAEGFGRMGVKEKIYFYYIAHGSLTETENLLLVTRDTGLVDKDTVETYLEQLKKAQSLLNGLIRSTKLR